MSRKKIRSVLEHLGWEWKEVEINMLVRPQRSRNTFISILIPSDAKAPRRKQNEEEKFHFTDKKLRPRGQEQGTELGPQGYLASLTL